MLQVQGHVFTGNIYSRVAAVNWRCQNASKQIAGDPRLDDESSTREALKFNKYSLSRLAICGAGGLNCRSIGFPLRFAYWRSQFWSWGSELGAIPPQWVSQVSKCQLKMNVHNASGAQSFSTRTYFSSMHIFIAIRCFWSSGRLLQDVHLQYSNAYSNVMFLELRASALAWASPVSKSTLQ